MHNIVELTDQSFEDEVLRSETPVLVDFGADWCHPCKQLDPIVEELASDWDGKVKIGKIDSDTNVETTMKYGVMGLPTLILFVNGEPKERLSGFQPKNKIQSKMEPHFGF
jgi:thioredoxin 1